MIVGPGTEEDRLRYRRMADERVRGAPIVFLPPMPARKAFALARTIVLPSRAELLPYIVLEAAGAAMPIIATNVGGIPEIFAGETERLVPPGDADALAAAMRGALTSLAQTSPPRPCCGAASEDSAFRCRRWSTAPRRSIALRSRRARMRVR